ILEQSYLLPAQLRKIKKYPSQVAAWVREAFDISLRNGIALQVYPNGRNGARCIPGCDYRLWSCCDNDVHFAPNKVTCSLLHQLWLERGIVVLDFDVFALHIAFFS